MKIQCDVCNKEEASVFCTADEAALCKGCDHRVHHANKLASKHHRFPLLNPTIKDAPRCDVCQERRAFLFCREDRAILCRECDLPIHTANEHTQKHNRFLLTGVKLASAASLLSNSCDASSALELKINSNSQTVLKTVTIHSPPPSDDSAVSNQSKCGGGAGGYAAQPVTNGGSTSSLAEYLIQTLPGWHVEDFLDSSSAPQNGFCKDDDLLPFPEVDIETNLASFPCDDLGIWVPQIPLPLAQQLHQINGQKIGFSKDMNRSSSNLKVNKRSSDHGFTVPQISPPSNKRSRSFW